MTGILWNDLRINSPITDHAAMKLVLWINPPSCYWDIAKAVFYCHPKEVLIRKLIGQILLWKLIGQMMDERLEKTKIGSYILLRIFFVMTCFPKRRAKTQKHW